MSLLGVEGLVASHGLLRAVRGVDLSVDDGQVLALIGANGAGKTTLLRAIAGAHPAGGGRIVFDGRDVTALPAHRRVAEGIAMVPEGRRLFPELTVRDNLLVAGRRGRAGPWDLRTVTAAFPMLADLLDRPGSALSGGQQQAVAIGRALMTNPRLLLLDEVSLGLSPAAVGVIYDCFSTLRDEGTTAVVVEQDLDRALSVSSRVVCLLEGAVALDAPSAAVTRPQVTAAYFGAGSVTSEEVRAE